MLRSEHQTRRHLEPVACFSTAPWPCFSSVSEIKAARVTPRGGSRGAGRPPGSPAGGSRGPALCRRQGKQKRALKQCWARTGGDWPPASPLPTGSSSPGEFPLAFLPLCPLPRQNPPVGQPDFTQSILHTSAVCKGLLGAEGGRRDEG